MTKRPTQFDDEILKLTAQSLLEEIKRWFTSGGDCPPDDEIVEDLTKALQYNTDGFEIAKSLEDYSYWDGDSDLVDVLNGAYGEMRKHLEQAEEKWVKENNLQPISIGKMVRILDGGKLNDFTGEVIGNHLSGYSIVFVEKAGHVRERGGVGTHGIYIAWEKLGVACPEYGEGC